MRMMLSITGTTASGPLGKTGVRRQDLAAVHPQSLWANLVLSRADPAQKEV